MGKRTGGGGRRVISARAVSGSNAGRSQASFTTDFQNVVRDSYDFMGLPYGTNRMGSKASINSTINRWNSTGNVMAVSTNGENEITVTFAGSPSQAQINRYNTQIGSIRAIPAATPGGTRITFRWQEPQPRTRGEGARDARTYRTLRRGLARIG